LWEHQKGKFTGVPVHTLLGGQVRDRIKVLFVDRTATWPSDEREQRARGGRARLQGGEA